MGTAGAVTEWLGTEVSATSARLLQTMGGPSSDSQHPLALGTLHSTGPGSDDATWVPAVTSAHGPGQPVGTAEPHSAGTHVPAREGTLAGTLSQSPSTMDQPRGDQMLSPGLFPDHQIVPSRAGLSSAVSSEPPAVVTARDEPSWSRAVTAAQAASSVPAPHQATATDFSDAQHGAPVARATKRSPNEQKKEVRPNPALPDLGRREDHTAAPHLVPLPGLPSALPKEGTSSSTKMHPGTDWVPSNVTLEMPWDTQPAGTFLHGEAALLGNAVSAKVSGNESGLLATVLASPSSTVVAHDVTPPPVLAPIPPPVVAGGPAVTSGVTRESSPSAQQTLPTSTEAHRAPAWTRVLGTASPTGASLAAPDAIPEPGVTQVPCEDGAGVVASQEDPRSCSSQRAGGVTHGFPLGSPTQRPLLHQGPFLTASECGPAAGQDQATKEAEMSMQPGEAGHSEPRTASAGPTAAPAGPSESTHASPGSVPSPSSKNPALECCSEAVHHTSTTSLPSPLYLLPSTGAVSAASSHSLAVPAAVTLDAQSMARPSATSHHPSTAPEHLYSASGEVFTRAGLMTKGKPGSSRVKPSVHRPAVVPAQLLPTHVLPLQFRLLGIAYSKALSNPASESYRKLEEDVRLLLNQMLSTYETFLQAHILEFRNGSVVVQGEAVFRGDAPAPTSSHLIRTILAEVSKGGSIFRWRLEPQSVQSNGFSLENLDPEKLSISLTIPQLGRNKTVTLEKLVGEVVWSLSAFYEVRNFTVVQLRNVNGELKITGDLYLDTIVHADLAEVLQALTALAACSVDLTSLSVEGAKLDLQVYPVSFLITNRHFNENLLDPLDLEHQELTRSLGEVVASVLRRDHKSFLQVVIRGFLPGSLICHGDVVFQNPAPTSLQVLEALVLSVGPDKALDGSDFQVDPYSLAVGDTLEPPQPQPGFPDYGVAIIVVCGLCIIAAPIAILLYLRARRLSRWDRPVLWDRRNAEVGTQTMEMENRGFWAFSEQIPEDVQTHGQDDSVL
ncbi:nascent polypeptide-associated complex subunit alpha, muscle-specific form-like isoform X2 [Melanerpes formicivorus]|uniref:nascent polypeptide-associated complex subunit alpha, muscle-specific form-like isoform X2 n=1 Tax=Melanerpes formicivorus TaxID=211600 RepID=UPI00358E364E